MGKAYRCRWMLSGSCVFYSGKEDQVSGREMAADWLTAQSIRGFEQLITHFIDCVEQRITPYTSAQEAFRTQLLLEQMVAAGM